MMVFKIEKWLANHRKTWRTPKREANTLKALKKHDIKRSDSFTEKCQRLFPEIKELNDQGYTAREISIIIGVEQSHIYHIFRKLNVKYNRTPISRR